MIAWIGNFLLAVCGLPQAYKSYKDGHSNGISWGFIIMWTVGEVCTLVYLLTELQSLPLILNYSVNGLFCSVIIYYKFKPRRYNESH